MTKLRTITVGRLRDLLEGEDPDMPVIFSTDYGDICHTRQALPLRGELDEVTVTESGYSNSGFAVTGDDEDDEPEPSEKMFLLIS